jgi:hypothetical protein
VSPASSAPASEKQSRVQQWAAALQHLETALRMPDESAAPPHIGAELDLAINRLKDVLKESPQEQS